MSTASGERETRLGEWLRINPLNKPKIYAQVYATAEIASPNYWAEIFLSGCIATFGLVLNSPAVIIGAMLISPLMGPIMASGLGLAAGDLYLTLKALWNLFCSISFAVVLSAALVWLLPFHSATGEILARTNPNLLDLGIALFSGLAGSIAVSRAGGSDGVTTLPGVAIAVALMPPLCTIGFGLGSGFNKKIMAGAGLLFLTNLVAIVASAFLVFLLIGMNSPKIRAQMKESRHNEALAKRLERGKFSRLLISSGQLRWRIAMLVVLLAMVAIPLRSALQQLASEAVARAAVQEAIKQLVPREAIVSQQVEVGRRTIAVQIVSTKGVSDANVQAADRAVEMRSGRKTEISVATVASQSELAGLMARLATPAPVKEEPVMKTFVQLNHEIRERVEPVLKDIWPSDLPTEAFSVDFSADGMKISVDYHADKPLDSVATGILERQLQHRLNEATLKLIPHRLPMVRAAKKH